jgi:signal transduction histidine kinase
VVVASRDITDRKQRERELEAIAAIAMALRAASTRAEMLPVIVQQTADLLTADGAALVLRDPATDQSVIALGLGVSADSTGLHVPRGAGIVGHVMTTSRPYLTQDVEHDPLTFRPDLAHGLRSVACTPLIAQDRILGALWAGRTTAITDEETRLLAAIADIAANALHRAEVLETLEQRVYDRTRELATANERLQELDRLKSKFVSDVSHELRTPITSLMLNVELLEHGKPEKRDQYLRVIRQQTTRQVQLIEDILNLSRLELSTTKTQFAPVNVNALIDQAVNVYRSSAEAANLRLTFTPASAQPVVMGVESHLSQVVTNLIANAINYTPAGSVEVSTQLVGHEVIIEVRDTGLGIAPEDMPHLFDRFYRGKLTWQVRGSGLGLAIVKEITEVHKGRVEVDSQAGVGSTFRVYLPIA